MRQKKTPELSERVNSLKENEYIDLERPINFTQNARRLLTRNKEKVFFKIKSIPKVEKQKSREFRQKELKIDRMLDKFSA